MKYSIKRQMATAFIGIVLFILFGCFAINGRFLEQYYVHNKVGVLNEMYRTIDSLLAKDEMVSSEQLNEALSPLAERSNVSLMVTDPSLKTVKIKMRTAGENEELTVRLFGYLSGKNQKASKLIAKKGNFELRRAIDAGNQSEYLEMWGRFSGGDIFLMRSPLESIRENVKLSNRFLIYIGICVILVSMVIVWYFSKKITDPS